MAGLIEGCNAAYDEVDGRSFIRKRGLALGFTVAGLVFLLLTLGLIAVLPAVLGTLGLGSGRRAGGADRSVAVAGGARHGRHGADLPLRPRP
jgi:hypothetical protein